MTKKREGGLRPVSEVRKNDYVLGLHFSSPTDYVRVADIVRAGNIALHDQQGRGRLYVATDQVMTMTQQEVDEASA